MQVPGAIEAGTRLGSYTVGSHLGKGATAAVYAATHDDGRTHALKVRRRTRTQLDRRFLREFESMRLLRVPGVVTVHDAGLTEHWLWFSMDLVDGQPLLDALHAELDLPARVARTMVVFKRLCDTLAALHATGYVHRDVKPSNVLVDADDGVHVVDFGIGRFFEEAETLSRTGELVGTLPYMSPEQLGSVPNNERTDLFAVGLMLHEAIAGRRPRPMTTVGWIPRICLERLVPLACLHREVPLGLSKVAERLCAVDPKRRPTAARAAAMLDDVLQDRALPEWPEAPFCDPGDWWTPAEAAASGGSDTRVIVLEGPTGSGRARIAEQVHRTGLLQGTWTHHLRCAVDEMGGPFRSFIESLVDHIDDDDLTEVLGDESLALNQLWPHLPLPTPTSLAPQSEHSLTAPSTGDLARAVADVIQRASERRGLQIVIADLEQADAFTARVIPELAKRKATRLGLLLLHEHRWATTRSRALIRKLVEDGLATVVPVPPLTEEVASAIASSLCPHMPSQVPAGSTAQYASEVGLAALARWRGETLTPPDASLWPVSVLDRPLPFPVLRALMGRRAAGGPWVRVTTRSVELAGTTARALARSRVASLRHSSQTLAETWERVLGEGARPGDLATLWLLAGQERRAWLPVAHAAIAHDQAGLYAEARRWLILLETLGQTAPSPELAFSLALARARVALRTDATQLRIELVDAAEQQANTPAELQLVDVIRAEYAQRAGTTRKALVKALHAAAPGEGRSARTAVQALLVAVQARLVLGQLEEAQRDLDRAHALIDGSKQDTGLTVEAGNLQADLAFYRHQLPTCRVLCEQSLRLARSARHHHGEARATARLGDVLRQIGLRREAEKQVRAARDAARLTGDVYLGAATGLALATLLCERGDVLVARHTLDQTIRLVRGLHLVHLMPAATRLALQIAVLRLDPTDAALALDAMQAHAQADPEAAAVLVRWWRLRGDHDRALAVPAPIGDSFGATHWHLERARTAIAVGKSEIAAREAHQALSLAEQGGYRELKTLARLVLGVVEIVSDAEWRDLKREAAGSLFTEVFLGALELDARRLAQRGDTEGSRGQWLALAARSRELGYRPGMEEAAGWLERGPP